MEPPPPGAPEGPESFEQSHGRYYTWALLSTLRKTIDDKTEQLRNLGEREPLTEFHVLLSGSISSSAIIAVLVELAKSAIAMQKVIADFEDYNDKGDGGARTQNKRWLEWIFDITLRTKKRITNIRYGLEGRRGHDVDRDLQTYLRDFPYTNEALSIDFQFYQRARPDGYGKEETDQGFLFELFGLLGNIEHSVHKLNVELYRTALRFQNARVNPED